MPLNPKMQMWNKLVSEHRRKHGGTLKEAMQSKKVKAEYQRKVKEMEGGRKMSPKRKTTTRKPSGRATTSPRRKTTRRATASPRRKTTRK